MNLFDFPWRFPMRPGTQNVEIGLVRECKPSLSDKKIAVIQSWLQDPTAVNHRSLNEIIGKDRV